MEKNCLGITEIQCYDFRYSETHSACHVEAREFHSLSYRIGGEVTITYRGNTITSGKDMLTFVPAHAAYETQVLTPGGIYVAHFKTALPVDEIPRVVRPEEPSVYRDLFSALCGSRDVYSSVSHLYDIFSRLRREYGAHQDPRLEDAVNYLEKNLYDPELTVKRLSDYAGVSEVYFRKLFHRHYGMQPVAYLKKRRIELAKALLSTGYYGISEVGERCGFSFPSYFAAEFKKETGMTPSAYLGRE